MADPFGKDTRPSQLLREGIVSLAQPTGGSPGVNLHLRIKSNRNRTVPGAARWRNRPAAKSALLVTSEKKRFWLTIGAEQIDEPHVWKLSRKFGLIFNIRGSSVTGSFGLLAIELEGPGATIDKAVRWLVRKGIQVDPLELNVIEG